MTAGRTGLFRFCCNAIVMSEMSAYIDAYMPTSFIENCSVVHPIFICKGRFVEGMIIIIET